jgi:hypothetical protein
MKQCIVRQQIHQFYALKHQSANAEVATCCRKSGKERLRKQFKKVDLGLMKKIISDTNDGTG